MIEEILIESFELLNTPMNISSDIKLLIDVIIWIIISFTILRAIIYDCFARRQV